MTRLGWTAPANNDFLGIVEWIKARNPQAAAPREIFEVATAACGYVDNASALTTSPQAPQPQQKDSIDKQNVLCSFAVPVARIGGVAIGGRLS